MGGCKGKAHGKRAAAPEKVEAGGGGGDGGQTVDPWVPSAGMCSFQSDGKWIEVPVDGESPSLGASPHGAEGQPPGLLAPPRTEGVHKSSLMPWLWLRGKKKTQCWGHQCETEGQEWGLFPSSRRGPGIEETPARDRRVWRNKKIALQSDLEIALSSPKRDCERRQRGILQDESL